MVATDSRNSTKSGKFLEVLGFYNATTKEHSLNTEKVNYWLSRGAKTSGTVNNLLIRKGVIKGKKIDVASRKKILKAEKAEGDAGAGKKEEEKQKETTAKDKKEETLVPKPEIPQA